MQPSRWGGGHCPIARRAKDTAFRATSVAVQDSAVTGWEGRGQDLGFGSLLVLAVGLLLAVLSPSPLGATLFTLTGISDPVFPRALGYDARGGHLILKPLAEGACPMRRALLALLFLAAPATANAQLVSAVLPTARSVKIDQQPITVFATVINTGTSPFVQCTVTPRDSSLRVDLTYQTTDPRTNALTGTPSTPFDIPAHGAQTLLLAVTLIPGRGLQDPLASDIGFNFFCPNVPSAPIVPGVNMLKARASAVVAPDVVAIAKTLNNDGIVNIGSVFAVATINLGAAGGIFVQATGPAGTIALVCQTDPITSVCLQAPDHSVVVGYNPNDKFTYGVFVTSSQAIAFNPAVNRVFVQFTDAAPVCVTPECFSKDVFLRGETSVAVRTP